MTKQVSVLSRANLPSAGGEDYGDSGVPGDPKTWTVWERFPGWLIDHCEGETISEEFLQQQLAEMIAKDGYTSPPPPQPAAVTLSLAPEGIHPETLELVRCFAEAMLQKLSEAEKKYGYTDEWSRKDWMEVCQRHLVEHVAKGDPRDVANFCAFMWHHNWRTTPGLTNYINAALASAQAA